MKRMKRVVIHSSQISLLFPPCEQSSSLFSHKSFYWKRPSSIFGAKNFHVARNVQHQSNDARMTSIFGTPSTSSAPKNPLASSTVTAESKKQEKSKLVKRLKMNAETSALIGDVSSCLYSLNQLLSLLGNSSGDNDGGDEDASHTSEDVMSVSDQRHTSREYFQNVLTVLNFQPKTPSSSLSSSHSKLVQIYDFANENQLFQGNCEELVKSLLMSVKVDGYSDFIERVLGHLEQCVKQNISNENEKSLNNVKRVLFDAMCQQLNIEMHKSVNQMYHFARKWPIFQFTSSEYAHLITIAIKGRAHQLSELMMNDVQTNGILFNEEETANIIKSYISVGQFNSAMKTIREAIHDCNLDIPASLYSTILSSMQHAMIYNHYILELLAELHKKCPAGADELYFQTALDLCVNMDCNEYAEQIFDQLAKHSHVLVTIRCLNPMIKLLCKTGKWREAHRLIQVMPSSYGGIHPDITSFTILRDYGSRDESLVKLLEEMNEQNVYPSIEWYNDLLASFKRTSGDRRIAMQIFKNLIKDGSHVQPTVETILTMIQLFKDEPHEIQMIRKYSTDHQLHSPNLESHYLKYDTEFRESLIDDILNHRNSHQSTQTITQLLRILKVNKDARYKSILDETKDLLGQQATTTATRRTFKRTYIRHPFFARPSLPKDQQS